MVAIQRLIDRTGPIQHQKVGNLTVLGAEKGRRLEPRPRALGWVQKAIRTVIGGEDRRAE